MTIFFIHNTSHHNYVLKRQGHDGGWEKHVKCGRRYSLHLSPHHKYMFERGDKKLRFRVTSNGEFRNKSLHLYNKTPHTIHIPVENNTGDYWGITWPATFTKAVWVPHDKEIVILP